VERNIESDERRENVIHTFRDAGEYLGRAIVAFLEHHSPSDLNSKGGMPRALLNAVDAAAYLSIGKSTLYELVNAGEVTRIKVGGSARFRRSDLDKFAQKRRK
jgi:excisionase family DNA binding protein